jgi:hypothetical protein
MKGLKGVKIPVKVADALFKFLAGRIPMHMKAELRCELEGRAVAVIFSNNDSVSGNL